jgi:AraC-like DNA-binding protein
VAQELPLSRFPFFETSHVDDAREALRRVYADGSLTPAGSGECFSQEFNVAPLGRVTLTAMGWGCGMTFRAPSLDDCFDFSSLIHGASEVRVGREIVQADPKCAVVMSPSESLHIRWRDPLLSLNAKIRRGVLESHLAAIAGIEIEERLEFSAAMPMAGAGASISRLIRLMAQEINQDESLLAHQLVAERYSETLLTAVLYAQPNNYSDRLGQAPGSAAPVYVRRAEEYMEAHCEEPITAPLLAAACGVSVRTLYTGFRKHRECTPFEFLRLARLRRVRAALLAAPAGTSVRELALKWGFNHLGRFSALYRKHFGESPAETVRRS